MSAGDGDGGVLGRWTARKEAVARREAEEAQAEARAAAEAAERAEREAEAEANRKAAEAIDLDTATYDTDFTPFLKAGVPQALRRRALQVLWRSDPVLANVDGLNDYDEDYRTVTSISEVVRSSWETGRGYAAKADEVRVEMEARDNAIRDEQNAKAAGASTEANAGGGAEPESPEADVDIADATGEESSSPSAEAAPAPAARSSLRQRLLSDGD